MPVHQEMQTNFTAGELSPRLEGRVDLNKYFNGVAELENFSVQPHGGASFRSGFRYVADVKTHSKETRLIPFEFSVTQAYVLEFGDQYMRVCMDEGQVGAPYEIATPYAEEDLFTLQFAQSADTLYIAHPNYSPRKLTRTGHASWTLTEITFTGGSFATEKTITGITQANPAVVTITAHPYVNGELVFIDRVVGMTEVNGAWYTVANKTANTFELSGIDSSAYTAYSSGGAAVSADCPRTVALYEERSVWAGTNNDPQKIFFSKTGDFEDMTVGTADDDGLQFTISADQVNVIQWLNPGDTLLVGTVGGEFEAHGDTPDTPITPTGVQINRKTTYGSMQRKSIRVGSQVLFLQRSGKKIREFVYSFENDNYQGNDLTILSEHITLGGVVDWDYQQEPDSVLWCVRSDGELLGFTYDRANQVVSWHRHPVGGTDAKVKSVAVIPAPSGDHDQLWCIIERTVNGATVKYIEFMENPYNSAIAQEDSFFVDSGLSYDGAPITSVSGLAHLEGETVAVLADGAVQSSKTVASGSITLDEAASVLHVGLPYTGHIKSLRYVTDMADGNSSGRFQRIHSVVVRLWRSLGCKVGPDENNLETILFRAGGDPMDSAPPLFTGDKEVSITGAHTQDARVVVRQEQPLPCNVLAIIPQMSTNKI